FSLSQLFGPENSRDLTSQEYAELSLDKASPYHLPSVIGALGGTSSVWAAGEALGAGAVQALFADDSTKIPRGVKELAELTKQYAVPLLRGDLSAFRRVSQYA